MSSTPVAPRGAIVWQCDAAATRRRLPRTRRLTGQADFRAILRSPAVARRRVVEGFARPNALGVARLGIVIGRKAAARAVARNQCKRWVREAFRARQFDLAGLDVVVRFRPRRERQAGVDTRSDVIEILSAIARCRDSLSA
ncbi:MAG: ribonuclease P protein component [Burkholderiales bacterium]